MVRIPLGPRPATDVRDFKTVYRRLEGALGTIAAEADVTKMLERVLRALLQDFGGDLGLAGGRLYQRVGDDYVLRRGFGSSRDVPPGLSVPRDYPPHVRTLREGLVVMSVGERGFDPAFERKIGVKKRFAAIAVGRHNSHVVAFSVDGEPHEEQVLYALTAVRHVINLKLEQRHVSGMLEESRLIQESLLPAETPLLEGLDLYARSRPVDLLGGDMYDYVPLSERRVGIAIADASGHGLPAALLVRDVITGLRMGTGEDVEPVRTIERLNRVIHRAALSSKFVSLFYVELDVDGTLVYANAGHNPPLLLRGGTCRRLGPTGPVLGPIREPVFRTRREKLDPGDTLVLYTDGLVERENESGEAFGVRRLYRVVREAGAASAADTTAAILAAVERHGGGAAVRDDVTVIVVRRI